MVLILFGLCILFVRSAKVGPIDVQAQGNVQRCNRAHSRCNIHFHIRHGKELIQHKAFECKERHNGQEYNERAVEQHHFEGAIVLRVLQIQLQKCNVLASFYPVSKHSRQK